MKSIQLILIATLLTIAVIHAGGQTPQFINYQAIARDAAGGLLVTQPINVRLTIHDGSAIGTGQYEETWNVTTNIYGLFTVQIGNGTVVSGTFAGITWYTGNKYLQVEVDPTGGGTSYVDMGTQQLVSVPYSLFAANANNATTLSGSVTMGGDISGTNAAANIAKIQGNTVTAASPASRQVLKWNGTAWTPANDSVNTYSAGTALTLSGTTFGAQNTTALWNANKLQGDSISTAAPTTGQVLQWTGTAWAPTAVASAGVTSVTAGAGLSGGTITTSGTISMPAVGTAGTYGSATQVPVFITDAEGRITGVTNTTITGPIYTGGTGISIAGTTITNTAPNQVVTITAGAGTTVTGTYPNFTITNTAGVPAGSIMAFGGDSAAVPSGWLLCNGLPYGTTAYPALYAVIGTHYGGSGGIFYVPDFRGMFLRGADLSATNDPDHAYRTAMNAGGNIGNNVGSVQLDTFKSHTHTSVAWQWILARGGGPFGNYYPIDSTYATGATGGNETRPKNAYVNYIIKY